MLKPEFDLDRHGGRNSDVCVSGKRFLVKAVLVSSGLLMLATGGIDTSLAEENNSGCSRRSTRCSNTILATSLTVSISGVIFFRVLLHDPAREPNLLMCWLIGGIKRKLTLRAKHVSQVPLSLHLLLVVVGDYNENE